MKQEIISAPTRRIGSHRIHVRKAGTAFILESEEGDWTRVHDQRQRNSDEEWVAAMLSDAMAYTREKTIEAAKEASSQALDNL
jgi:hypothetical protein